MTRVYACADNVSKGCISFVSKEAEENTTVVHWEDIVKDDIDRQFIDDLVGTDLISESMNEVILNKDGKLEGVIVRPRRPF